MAFWKRKKNGKHQDIPSIIFDNNSALTSVNIVQLLKDPLKISLATF